MSFRTAKIALSAIAGFLISCGSINDSWEIDGGGYLKYKVNGEGPFTIELGKNDVEPPYYVNNSHSYFYFVTNPKESSRKEQFSLMVNRPTTGGKLTPVAKANVVTSNGSTKYQDVTWMVQQGSSIQASLIPDSSYIHFDEIIKDSLYTANLELYFVDCRGGKCTDEKSPIHVSGRLRYWIPMDER